MSDKHLDEHREEVLLDLQIIDRILCKYFGPTHILRTAIRNVMKDYR